tara:strand:+ start:393 stop:689 length:297 start_codon:yes stop_codon:yes gene_type:complete
MYSDLYEKPEDITREALSWFTCYTGTFHRLQKRTKAEAKRALIVFCSLCLFEDYRDIKPVVRNHFIELFMASNTENKLTKKELKAGQIESKELLEYYD